MARVLWGKIHQTPTWLTVSSWPWGAGLEGAAAALHGGWNSASSGEAASSNLFKDRETPDLSTSCWVLGAGEWVLRYIMVSRNLHKGTSGTQYRHCPKSITYFLTKRWKQKIMVSMLFCHYAILKLWSFLPLPVNNMIFSVSTTAQTKFILKMKRNKFKIIFFYAFFYYRPLLRLLW